MPTKVSCLREVPTVLPFLRAVRRINTGNVTGAGLPSCARACVGWHACPAPADASASTRSHPAGPVSATIIPSRPERASVVVTVVWGLVIAAVASRGTFGSGGSGSARSSRSGVNDAGQREGALGAQSATGRPRLPDWSGREDLDPRFPRVGSWCRDWWLARSRPQPRELSPTAGCRLAHKLGLGPSRKSGSSSPPLLRRTSERRSVATSLR